MKRFRTGLAASAAGVVLATAALAAVAAPIVKWVDANGGVHYGEKAPDGVTGTRVKVDENEPSDAEAELKRLQERRTATSDKAAGEKPAEAAPATSATEMERINKICDGHRKNLEVLRSGQRAAVPDAKTGRRYLSPEEVQASIQKAEDELRRCEQLKAGTPAAAAPAP